jgi:hypothetical protein
LRWVRASDAPRLSRLLQGAFASHSRTIARLRFASILILTPHLTSTSSNVVVGIAPLPRPPVIRRVLSGLSWATSGAGRPFDPDRLPPILQSARQWRVINLASATGAHPAATVALARRVVALADRHRRCLQVEVQDPLHCSIYERHGFTQVGRHRGVLVRPPREVQT